MTSSEEQRAMKHLIKLLGSDLTEATDDDLLTGIAESEMAFDQAQGWTGRLVAEVRKRKIPWSRVERETGHKKATLDRRRLSVAGEVEEPGDD